MTSGTGRGAKFISLPIYSEIFQELLGDPPFFGTLNLILPKSETDYISNRFNEGKVFTDLEFEGKSYGGIVTIPLVIPCKDKNINAVAVRPHLTTHASNIIEIVSPIHLRECLELKDDDQLDVKF